MKNCQRLLFRCNHFIIILSASSLFLSVDAFFSSFPRPTFLMTRTFWSRSAEVLWEKTKEREATLTTWDCSGLEKSRIFSGSYDLSSPREWLEKQAEDSDKLEGGAYTVIRCDCSIPFAPTENSDRKWKVWGEDFHMNRLRLTYQKLVNAHHQGGDRYIFDAADQASKKIMQALLSDAECELTGWHAIQHTNSSTTSPAFTLMLTLLWQPSVDSCEGVVVRGHISTIGDAPTPQSYNPRPITASIALEHSCDSLPNRYNNIPEAKLSSWCRRRRPLEESYKVTGVGEVLMVLPSYDDHGNITDHAQILEGLTSNFFAIYPNGKLRTANCGILNGYARSLVIAYAKRCGLEVDYSPIMLSDSQLWEEVFVTSSVSIIKPVGKIIVPCNENAQNSMQELWSASPQRNAPPKWKTLYEEILKSVNPSF